MTEKVTKPEFDFRTIKSFEDACAKLGIDPLKLPDVSNLPEEFAKPIIAHYKLMVIFKAINDRWTPDWSDDDQYKWFPWFRVLPSGFGFSHSCSGYDCTLAGVGSRLCTDTDEKAEYIAEIFEQEYKDLFLYSEEEIRVVRCNAVVLPSGFGFSDSHSNYDYTNTNVSSHLCDTYSVNP